MNFKKMIYTALFTALVCVATMVLQIQTPVTNGYINIGDCFVLMSAWILGPFYGAFAGGVGSALADLLLSYAHYVPGTLIVKGLMAVIAALLYRRLSRRNNYLAQAVSGVVSELWMVAGYFIYASLILGKGLAAASSVPSNLLQGAVGLVAAIALIAALRETKALDGVNTNG